MEFQLPEQAHVHKTVPKSKFFARAVVNTKLKREFTDKVQKITWEYKLAPDTIGIPATETVEEIQIFIVELKERVIPKNVLKLIDKSIPYPILYVFIYGEQEAYGLSLKGAGEERYYFSDWGESLSLRFTGLTLEALYQGLIKSFIKGSSGGEGEDFATMVATDKQRQVLEKEIQALKNKIRNEKQFNKKIELNHTLQAKQKDLASLTKETV
jgi:hypothetical protein